MLNLRLINMIDGIKKYIVLNVLLQWIALVMNIITMIATGLFFDQLLKAESNMLLEVILVFLSAIGVRFVCVSMSDYFSFLSTGKIKVFLREKIYEKILDIGVSFKEKVKTADIVKIAGEGVEQLEVYFSKYLPQFFYCMIAPITLFIVLSFINIYASLVLLICVPLIPFSIIMIRKKSKKVFNSYWGAYTDLSAVFLENLRGLTTLKIFGTDGIKHDYMDEESEKFRKSTMRVLKLQLNSITVMDLIAYGGAAIGIVVSIIQFAEGNMTFGGCFAIVMLSSEFFIPLRLLGSFFHVSMNGMAAFDKILEILNIDTGVKGSEEFKSGDIDIQNMEFSYGEKGFSLKNINMKLPKNRITSIVGESGSGKSTIASILTGRKKGYNGSIKIGGVELKDLSETSLNRNITIVQHDSHIFKGTLRDNLLMAKADATDDELRKALKKVALDMKFHDMGGLESFLSENGSNISVGQKQRIALARALLHSSPVYVFDEATSNIDIDSEEIIQDVISELAKDKTILIISHRLQNVVCSDNIYVIDDGRIIEEGTHDYLIDKNGFYTKLYFTQKTLESYSGGSKNSHRVRSGEFGVV